MQSIYASIFNSQYSLNLEIGACEPVELHHLSTALRFLSQSGEILFNLFYCRVMMDFRSLDAGKRWLDVAEARGVGIKKCWLEGEGKGKRKEMRCNIRQIFSAYFVTRIGIDFWPEAVNSKRSS